MKHELDEKVIYDNLKRNLKRCEFRNLLPGNVIYGRARWWNDLRLIAARVSSPNIPYQTNMFDVGLVVSHSKDRHVITILEQDVKFGHDMYSSINFVSANLRMIQINYVMPNSVLIMKKR